MLKVIRCIFGILHPQPFVAVLSASMPLSVFVMHLKETLSYENELCVL